MHKISQCGGNKTEPKISQIRKYIMTGRVIPIILLLNRMVTIPTNILITLTKVY